MTSLGADQKLFDIADAVAYLQGLGAKAATVNFVRGIISSGEVPHLRIGKKFFIGREALDRWIDQRQRRK